MKKICVDLDRCEGHGRCYAIAPDLLGPIDDHGHAGFVGDGIDPADEKLMERANRAVRSCPEDALSWEQPDDGARAAPE
jgi:ferredoxin